MRISIILCSLMLVVSFAGCDMRSGTAKEEMEKFSGTPTPARTPVPAEIPVDPADVIRVETDVPGETVSVYGADLKKSVVCSKFNRVMVNGNRNVVTVKGACQRIMVNGDGNEVISDATLEFVLNGNKNTVNYSRFVNGKRPIVNDNGDENIIEKTSASKVSKLMLVVPTQFNMRYTNDNGYIVKTNKIK